MRLFFQGAVIGFLGMGMACAPLQTSLYIREAGQALREAQEQEAAERSPYAWTKAELYLEKAREKGGRSQYEQAMEYSKKAKQWALAARSQAMSVPKEAP